MNGLNYTGNTFKYSSKQYTLLVTLFTKTDNKDNDLQISLDGSDIEEVMYENKMNDLLVRGHVIYTDRYAAVDKMMNTQYCYCEIMFAENEKEDDNGAGAGKLSEDKKFNHNFIVSNIKVLARDYSIIKYQIDIVSMNWFKCAANINYSNYGKPAEQIFDIVKNCLTLNKLAINTESFDRVKTSVRLNYITKCNDNMFSVLKYLLHKLYYSKDIRDDSLKFIIYDQYNDEYRLLDLKDKYTTFGSFGTILSFFKTNNEALILQEPTNIGSFSKACPKQNLFFDLFTKHMHSYDYNYDMLIDNKIASDEIANYLNNKLDNDNYEQKYQKMFTFPELKHEYVGMYWENEFDVYNESITALEENNSLVLNIVGDVVRQPGSMNVITLDRSIENITSEDKKELEKLKKKYKAYEGIWIASKVRNMIYPQRSSYRQQVALFRNFIPKLAPAKP